MSKETKGPVAADDSLSDEELDGVCGGAVFVNADDGAGGAATGPIDVCRTPVDPAPVPLPGFGGTSPTGSKNDGVGIGAAGSVASGGKGMVTFTTTGTVSFSLGGGLVRRSI